MSTSVLQIFQFGHEFVSALLVFVIQDCQIFNAMNMQGQDMSHVLVSDAEHALHLAEQALLVERFSMALPLLTVSCRNFPGIDRG